MNFDTRGLYELNILLLVWFGENMENSFIQRLKLGKMLKFGAGAVICMAKKDEILSLINNIIQCNDYWEINK